MLVRVFAFSLACAFSVSALRIAPAAVAPSCAVSPSRFSSLVMEISSPVSEPPAGMVAVQEEMWSDEKKPHMRIEGGDSLRTFKLGKDDERLQYIIASPEDRPIKARVELWIGPIRCVHTLLVDSQSGSKFPIKGTLQFKKGVEPVLKISTNGEYEFPLIAGVFVPKKEESKRLGEIKKDFFYSAPMKERVQGGTIINGNPKGGAIRNFVIPSNWKKTQIMLWAKDVGKKSMKSDIEFLQGPNEAKQKIFLQCGGSTQPWHGILETPGGGVIRCNSKKFMEDGLFEIAVGPWELDDEE